MSDNGHKPKVFEQVVSCHKCNKKITITLDLDDKQYLQDVLEELGWYNHLCTDCQDKTNIEDK